MSEYADDYTLAGLILLNDFLDEKEKWTKQCFAKKANGMGVLAQHPEAVCWCLSGAAFKATGACNDYLNKRLMDFGWGDNEITVFNDHDDTTFEHIKLFLGYCIDYRKWELEVEASS